MSLLQKWKQSRRRMAQMMGAPTGIRETGRRAPDTDDDVVSSRRTNRRDVAALGAAHFFSIARILCISHSTSEND
ncbi:hypothetical protein Y032_0022g517 [Ancylostoma ceylanicum]|uniref:Uncharacterized protein n=1 Tax=Ancylostoma ceylanicum TaxID=53326 RepID=A0A016UYY4_9BILA|nr:hypothetical protein Y032_0022g517 [Ancylostoma ceylanicum]